jgi:hypothetical protein
VPDEQRFRWWKSLRDVPSAWLSSQGEAERFLYYDGPTLAKSPHHVVLEPAQLAVTPRNMFLELYKDLRLVRDSVEERECIFIDATGQELRAIRFQVASKEAPKVVDLPQQTWLTGDAAETCLASILRERGLTDAEAEGLLVSWRDKFFQSAGKRLITVLSAADYDRFCPLQVRPKPTEIVRVGLILKEL